MTSPTTPTSADNIHTLLMYIGSPIHSQQGTCDASVTKPEDSTEGRGAVMLPEGAISESLQEQC